jgi:nitric oxide reductase large subunit
MTDRPTAAFVFSLIGGIATLIIALVGIRSWFSLSSRLGPGFSFGWLGFPDVTSAEAIILFVVGAILAVLTIAGAVVQYSGRKSRVKTGSIFVLVFSLAGIPFTFFGMIIGGSLSTAGALLGLTWKSESAL